MVTLTPVTTTATAIAAWPLDDGRRIRLGPRGAFPRSIALKGPLVMLGSQPTVEIHPPPFFSSFSSDARSFSACHLRSSRHRRPPPYAPARNLFPLTAPFLFRVRRPKRPRTDPARRTAASSSADSNPSAPDVPAATIDRGGKHPSPPTPPADELPARQRLRSRRLQESEPCRVRVCS